MCRPTTRGRPLSPVRCRDTAGDVVTLPRTARTLQRVSCFFLELRAGHFRTLVTECPRNGGKQKPREGDRGAHTRGGQSSFLPVPRPKLGGHQGALCDPDMTAKRRGLRQFRSVDA